MWITGCKTSKEWKFVAVSNLDLTVVAADLFWCSRFIALSSLLLSRQNILEHHQEKLAQHLFVRLLQVLGRRLIYHYDWNYIFILFLLLFVVKGGWIIMYIQHTPIIYLQYHISCGAQKITCCAHFVPSVFGVVVSVFGNKSWL